jgi:5-formyltetrahydrofolate cyclo-ligase
MRKATLRQEMRAARRALADHELAALSAQVVQVAAQTLQLLQYTGVLRRAAVVHCFLPIAQQRELDTWPLVRHLWDLALLNGVQVVVPVTHADEPELHNALLATGAPLITNAWGIPEPQEIVAVADEEIDVVLVPMLGFDWQGHRVGYGRGYYDRLLARLSPQAYRLGLCLFNACAEPLEDVDEYDQTLHACATPEGLVIF